MKPPAPRPQGLRARPVAAPCLEIIGDHHERPPSRVSGPRRCPPAIPGRSRSLLCGGVVPCPQEGLAGRHVSLRCRVTRPLVTECVLSSHGVQTPLGPAPPPRRAGVCTARRSHPPAASRQGAGRGRCRGRRPGGPRVSRARPPGSSDPLPVLLAGGQKPPEGVRQGESLESRGGADGPVTAGRADGGTGTRVGPQAPVSPSYRHSPAPLRGRALGSSAGRLRAPRMPGRRGGGPCGAARWARARRRASRPCSDRTCAGTPAACGRHPRRSARCRSPSPETSRTPPARPRLPDEGSGAPRPASRPCAHPLQLNPVRCVLWAGAAWLGHVSVSPWSR